MCNFGRWPLQKLRRHPSARARDNSARDMPAPDMPARRLLSFRGLPGGRLRLHRINWRSRSASDREFWKFPRLSLRLRRSAELPWKRPSDRKLKKGRGATFRCKRRRWASALWPRWSTESLSPRHRLCSVSFSGRSQLCGLRSFKFWVSPPESLSCSGRPTSIYLSSTPPALRGCAPLASNLPVSTALRRAAPCAAGASWLHGSPPFPSGWDTPGSFSTRTAYAGTTGSRTRMSRRKGVWLQTVRSPHSLAYRRRLFLPLCYLHRLSLNCDCCHS